MNEKQSTPEATTYAKRWFLWGIPVVLGLLVILLLTLIRPTPEPVTMALPQLPSTLILNTTDGKLSISGVLPEHAHSERMLTNIKQIFGKNTATGELQISKQAAPAEWLLGASNFLAALPGTEELHLKITDDLVMLSGRVATNEARQLLLDRAAIQFGEKLNASVDVTQDAAAIAASKSAWHARLSDQIRFAREAEARAQAEFIASEQTAQLGDQQAEIDALRAQLASAQHAQLSVQSALETQQAETAASLATQSQQAEALHQAKLAFEAEQARTDELALLVDEYRAGEIARAAEQARIDAASLQAAEQAAQQAETARLAAIAQAEHAAQLAERVRLSKLEALAEAKRQAVLAELAANQQRALNAEQARLSKQRAAIQSYAIATNCEQELNQLATSLPLVFIGESTAIDGASYSELGVLAQHIRLCQLPIQSNDLSITVSTAQGNRHAQALIDYLETIYGVYPGLLRAINHPVTQSTDNPSLYFSLSAL